MEGTEDALVEYRDLRHWEIQCKGLQKVQSMRQLMVMRIMLSLSFVFDGCNGLKKFDCLVTAVRQNLELAKVALDFQSCSQLSSIDELLRKFSRSLFLNPEHVSLEVGCCSNLQL